MTRTTRFEVLHAALLSATDEMGIVLKRSSHSTIIREMDDFSCAIFDPEGSLVAQGDFIPAQLGAMSTVVRSTLERHRDTLSEGDVFIANDPYDGGAHTLDINVLAPVFVGGRLVAWTGTAAHHADFGGPNPGTEGPDLGELFAEGLVLPPIRLHRAGGPVQDVYDLVAANIREPVATLSDLRAQVAACAAGARRVLELVDHHGVEAVGRTLAEVLDYGERRTAARLAELPDGETEAEGFLDDDGRGGPPTRIHARLVKRGARLTVDFSGSAAQVAGALNNPWATTRACTVYLVKALTDPELPFNDGAMRVLDIVCPEGSVLRPRRPAAVSVRHLTAQRTADTLIRAAGALWPQLHVGSGMVGFFGINLACTSRRTGRRTTMQDVLGGGTGGHPDAGGLDGVDTYMSNVGLLPIEVAESEYPVLVLDTSLVHGSGGAGRHHGGSGIRREYLVLEGPDHATIYCEQSDARFVPRGAAGGADGSPTRFRVYDPDGALIPTRSKTTLTLQPGSRVVVETGGGGGWGDAGDTGKTG
jgi:N-methylhydantoinase B